MLPDPVASKASYDRFIASVRKHGEVYGLQAGDGGWAVCPSEEEEGADVIVFWSDRAYAAQHKKEDWRDYVVTPIPLDEFVEAWLKGMHEDGSIVGPDWDVNLCGLEVEPIDVAKRLTDDDRQNIKK